MLVALRYKNNWADEFDVQGIIIVEEQWWIDHIKEVKAHSKSFPKDVGFGTNEDIEYSSAKDYLDSFTDLVLTQEEIRSLEYALGGRTFGIVPVLAFDDDEEEDQ